MAGVVPERDAAGKALKERKPWIPYGPRLSHRDGRTVWAPLPFRVLYALRWHLFTKHIMAIADEVAMADLLEHEAEFHPEAWEGVDEAPVIAQPAEYGTSYTVSPHRASLTRHERHGP